MKMESIGGRTSQGLIGIGNNLRCQLAQETWGKALGVGRLKKKRTRPGSKKRAWLRRSAQFAKAKRATWGENCRVEVMGGLCLSLKISRGWKGG